PRDPGLHPLRGLRGDAEPGLPPAREVEGARHLAPLPSGGRLVSARRRTTAFVLAASAVLGACKDGVTSPSPGKVVGNVTLAIGQEAPVEGTGLRILFRAVSDDSRCPADVTCVWEGDAGGALRGRGAATPPASSGLAPAR